MAGSSATARHALSMSRLRSILLPLTVMPRVVFCHPMPSHLAPAPHILPDGRRTLICLCPRHRRRWRPSSACRCRGCSLSARPFPYNGEVVWSVCPCPLFFHKVRHVAQLGNVVQHYVPETGASRGATSSSIHPRNARLQCLVADLNSSG